MKRILVLTSSRADFGIYLPLLSALKSNPDFELEILAFGTHLSPFHGRTIDNILESGFEVKHTISSLLLGDKPVDIASSYGLTVEKFSDFWNIHQQSFDWVLVLGDRYEMAAAVAAAIPFNISFAHLHGGETTLGAIDNIYRHSISLASKLHFVAHETFKERLVSLLGSNTNIHVVGSLSLHNLKNIELLSKKAFYTKWGFDFENKKAILVTVHPETVKFEENEHYAEEVTKAISSLAEEFNFLVTMPNSDTLGSIYREKLQQLKDENPLSIFLYENLGTQSYFSAMKHADIMLGNTSSGIIEAASFNKYVVNLGDRQKGRLAGDNVIHVNFNSESIVEAVQEIRAKTYNGRNIYHKGNTAAQIIQVIENL
jgi:GDP/UDP-N,N'-diacetylbacillosamine 2-epimerase (hydrolysing)